MKICAIDSSGLTAGIAVINDGIAAAEYCVQHGVTHSQTLLPMLDEVLRRLELDINDMDAYAVSAGPGSFTGLRIGIATVKGLGLVADKPVVAVPTLEMLSYNACGATGLICPIMDARREQVYTGVYRFDRTGHGYALRTIHPQCALSFDELCDILNDLNTDVMFIGDGVPIFKDRMKTLLTCEYSLAPAHMNRQRAASLGALAEAYLRGETDGLEGHVTTAEELTPIYLRLSQAERERLEREEKARLEGGSE